VFRILPDPKLPDLKLPDPIFLIFVSKDAASRPRSKLSGIHYKYKSRWECKCLQAQQPINADCAACGHFCA
jgi:hypothetical protein